MLLLASEYIYLIYIITDVAICKCMFHILRSLEMETLSEWNYEINPKADHLWKAKIETFRSKQGTCSIPSRDKRQIFWFFATCNWPCEAEVDTPLSSQK